MPRPFLPVGTPGLLQRVANIKYKLAKKPKIPANSWKILRGDKVQIVQGRKDVGKEGTVIKVVRKRNAVLVQGLNMSTRYRRPDAANSGAMYRKESLIDVSKVALLDPTDNKPTSVKLRRLPDTGEQVRISARTNTPIPKSATLKFSDPKKREPNAKTDTPSELALAVTYQPPEVLQQYWAKQKQQEADYYRWKVIQRERAQAGRAAKLARKNFVHRRWALESTDAVADSTVASESSSRPSA